MPSMVAFDDEVSPRFRGHFVWTNLHRRPGGASLWEPTLPSETQRKSTGVRDQNAREDEH